MAKKKIDLHDIFYWVNKADKEDLTRILSAVAERLRLILDLEIIDRKAMDEDKHMFVEDDVMVQNNEQRAEG